MDKSEDAFRTISEAAEDLDLPQHVLRFWETRFPQIRPMKRGGGRRYYRPDDVELLRAIRQLLYSDGYTIKGVQRILKERGVRAVLSLQGEGAASGLNALQSAASSPTIAQDGPVEQALWSDHHDGPMDDAAFFDSVSQSSPPAPAADSIPPIGAPASLPLYSAPVPALSRPVRGFAPEWTVDQHRKLTSIVAELAECRRILSAANI